MVQWLGFSASTAGGMTLIPSQGTKTLHATQHGEKKECYCGKCFESGSISCSVISDSATPSTVAFQAPPSMGFSRQEYWSGRAC